MFVHVAWIDMLSHLKHDGLHKNHCTVAGFLQHSGFSIEFLAIFAVEWFEDELFTGRWQLFLSAAPHDSALCTQLFHGFQSIATYSKGFTFYCSLI
ncbi:unnamed protein product [Heligmosomoides polygyrus]|uniref:Secreted protein n=1 Tax=Heligmosomoides polygyrus TaxID=6339 RepID=A0A183G1P2_HELPZ|nr:unnamed protein product [Heligmosomoides polygyrus]